MNRIDTSRRHSRPKHEQTAIALVSMIADLRILLQENALPDPVTRAHAITIMGAARRDLEKCTTPMSKMIKLEAIADFSISDHSGIILSLTNLSLKLKTNEPYTAIDLDAIKRQINDLDNCREDLQWSR